MDGSLQCVKNTNNMKVSEEVWEAFQIYQQYDDWSNETEKTDFTYSPLSRFHKREIVPGLTVRPNISRSPISSSSSLTNSGYKCTTEVEQSANNSGTSWHTPLRYEPRRRWLKNNIVVIWVKKSVININTIIKKSRAANLKSARTRHYLWLLLLPVLLLAAWYMVTEDTNDYITQCLPTLEHITHAQSFTSHIATRLSENFLFLWQAFLNGLLHVICAITHFITGCTAYVLNLILVVGDNLKNITFESAYSAWHFFKETYLFVSEAFFMGLQSILMLGNITSMDSSVKNVWVEGNANKNPDTIPAEGFTHDMISSGDFSDTIASITSRIQVLEDSLRDQKMRSSEEDARRAAVIAESRQTLLAHRLHADALLKRCCRWPCQKGFSSSLLSHSESAVSELEAMIASVRQSVANDIGELRSAIEILSRELGEIAIGSYDYSEVKRIVRDAIKLYDADKTGKADYALETAGGRVVSIRCTKGYSNREVGWQWLPSLWSSPGSPEEAIRPGVAPGQCWAFQGATGQLALELSYRIHITGFTMEHIPKELSPSGAIESAPRHFAVWGLAHAEDLTEQFLLGEYVYEDNGETLQYFPVQNPTDNSYKFIELKIISNHGHPEYTCVYRIRVHGKVA